MVFSAQQLQETLNIIEFNTSFFIGSNVGVDVLKKNDIDILRKFGVELKDIQTDFPQYEQSFYLGKLASILKGQTNKLEYGDFRKYLQKGQYIPLSDLDKQVLSHLKENTYSHIKNLESGIKTDISSIINGSEIDHRLYYEDLIKDELKRAVTEKDTVKSVVSQIGEKTKDWQRNLGRIAETEMQNAYSYGRFNEFVTRFKDRDFKLYKEVYSGACRHCIRLYLTKGTGSAPKLFTPQELLANGTNIGLKTKDWKPVIGSTHCYCRCDLRIAFANQEWDTKSKDFKYKEVEKKYEGEIRIQVGDKQFVV